MNEIITEYDPFHENAITIDSLPVALLLFDDNGDLRRHNKKAVELWGRDLKIGERRENLLTPESPHPESVDASDGDSTPLFKVLRSGQPSLNHEVVIERPDGSRIVALETIEPMKDSSDHAIGAIIAYQAIPLRERTETKPLNTEERFRALFENGADGGALLNREGIIFYVPSSRNPFLDYLPEDLVGRGIEMIHPDEADEARETLARLLLYPEETATTQYRCQSKDGSWRWVEATANNRLDDPRVGAIVVNFRDITERKRIEERLQRSERRYRGIFSNTRAAMLLIDSETGAIVEANSAACRFYGYSSETLSRMKLQEICALAEDILMKILREASAEPSNLFRLAQSISSGETRETEVICGPIEDSEHPLLFAIIYDVTERIRAEEALKESEIRNRAILDSSMEAVVTIDDQGRILEFNHAAERIFGIACEEAIDQKTIQLIIPRETRDAHERAMDDYRRTGECPAIGRRMEVTAIRGDGIAIPVEIAMTRVPIEDRTLFTAFIHDISDKKEAERALRASEERFRIAAGTSTDVIFDAILKSARVKRFGNLERLFGRANPPETYECWESMIHPEDKGRIRDTIRRHLDAGEPYALKYRLIREDGMLLHIEERAIVLKDESGKPYRVIGTTKDVTESHLAQERAETRARQQEAIAELSQSALISSSYRALLRDAARLLTETLGAERSLVLELQSDRRNLIFREGMGWGERLFDGSKVQASQIYLSTLNAGEGTMIENWEEETRFVYQPLFQEHGIKSSLFAVIRGSEKPWGVLQAHSQRVRFFANQDAHFVQSIANVLAAAIERERILKELKESTLQFRSLSNASIIGICEPTLEGNYVSANDVFIRMVGYTREEFESEGLSWKRLTAPEFKDLDEKAFIELQQYGACTPYEKEYIHKDGSRVPVLIAMVTWMGEEKRRILSYTINLTERKRLEERLFQSQKMEALGRLAGGVAHDFNNLLTVINGYSELLLLQAEVDNSLRRKIEMIKESGERAAGLTRQLLAFSRKQVTSLQSLDVNQAILDADKILRRLIGEDIEFVTVLHPDELSVKADPSQIEQILMNLAVNARDAMPAGGRLSIRASQETPFEPLTGSHGALSPGSYALIEVEDMGIGMENETIRHIFEPFFTTKGGAGRGTGLGLSTVYGIVEQLGGMIDVSSAVGKGSTFRVYLPLVANQATRSMKESRSVDLTRGSETILLAEDEDVVREMIKGVLEERGYRVIDATNGEEALRACQSSSDKIHLLLSDMVMPRMGGRELAERLKGERPDVRILFMSGYTDDRAIRQGIRTEDTQFIAKPFTIQSLLEKIDSMLRDSSRSERR